MHEKCTTAKEVPAKPSSFNPTCRVCSNHSDKRYLSRLRPPIENLEGLREVGFPALKTITYNHLNLPQVISFENGNSIEFVYTAAGTKLRKTVKTGGVITYEQDYVNGIEYRKVATSRKVEAIYHQEGRRYNTNVTTTSSTLALRYEFSMRDHLGNTRLSFTDKDSDGVIEVTNDPNTNEILQENHYYPFGLALNGPWINDNSLDNRYQYNGKEIDEDFGLKVYHYGARIYDPAIGRFTGVDPISDKFPWVSTYNYAENEPVANIDLWGLQAYKPKMKDFNKPSDVSGFRPVNNLVEGVKTVVVENYTIVKNWVTSLKPGTPSSADYEDTGNTRNGSGIEMFSKTSNSANGTIALDEAKNGSTVALDDGEIIRPTDAGGAIGEAVKKNTYVANLMYYTGLAIDKFPDIVSNLNENSNGQSGANNSSNNSTGSSPSSSTDSMVIKFVPVPGTGRFRQDTTRFTSTGNQ